MGRRNDLTREYYPNPLTCQEFVNKVEENLPAFLENILRLKDNQKQFMMEDWMQMFMDWSEIFPEVEE